jgi:hypothetical protein
MDRGTIFYKEHVLTHPGVIDTPADTIAGTILFRRFNKNETWTECFAPNITRKHWNWNAMLDALYKRAATAPVFTAAFVVSGCRVKPGQTKIQNQWEDALHDFSRSGDLWDAIQSEKDPKQIHWALMQNPGIGPFLAYEIYSDLMYTGMLIPKEDDWANAGPGAKAGLAHIWPNRRDYLQCMYDLRNMQQEMFDKLGLPFEDYALENPDGSTKWLTMRNIEHNLCEYSKHVRGTCRYQFTDHGNDFMEGVQ